jgi:hypothetical protein
MMGSIRTAIVLVLLAVLIPCGVWATQLNACDVNGDGVLTGDDIQLVMNMALGIVPCTAQINGNNVCNAITAQRVINAVLGSACIVTPAQHSATLTWTASTTPSVTYNVYKGTVSGFGPYTLLASGIMPLTYVDTAVQAGLVYYYVVTAVDSNSNESAWSNFAVAVIPFP